MSRLLFATGGSGGHIYPALAVAAAAAERGHEIGLIGQTAGMEERLAAQAGVPFTGVASGKLDRQRPDPRSLLSSLSGIRAAVAVLRQQRPELVVGFGGFASFPGCAAAVLTGTPLLLHEQNAFPGLVTRLLSPFARAVVVSQDAVKKRLRARRMEVIPYPVRERRMARSEARRVLGLPQEGTLTLVMGGSQGSVALNDATVAALKELRDVRPLVLHSTGPAHFERVRGAAAGISNYIARPYLDSTCAWSAADLAITRAGYGTLSEAAYFGVPLIMMPLPTAAENHQLHNARAFAEAGAGRVLEQDEAAQQLPGLWREMLSEPNRLAAAQAAESLSPVGAAERFVELIDELTAASTGGALQETK